jgi:hypothetical protein
MAPDTGLSFCSDNPLLALQFQVKSGSAAYQMKGIQAPLARQMLSGPNTALQVLMRRLSDMSPTAAIGAVSPVPSRSPAGPPLIIR